MRSTTLRLALHSLAAALALVAIVVGIPVLLIVMAGWPLPTRLPDLDRVRTALHHGDIPAQVVVRAIAVVVWIVWAQLVWAAVFDLVGAVRAHRRPDYRPGPVPLVPAKIGSSMGRLVAIALSFGVVTSTTAGATLVAKPTPVAAAPASSSPAPPSPKSPAHVDQRTGPVWLVARGDTCWDIAVSALGDGGRVGEILELNPTLWSPRNLQPGQLLRLPLGAAVPLERQPSVPATTEAGGGPSTANPPTGRYLPGETITVAAGDTLWSVSADRLTAANGTSVADHQVLDYLHAIVAGNPNVADDPDLIFPGEQITLPANGEPPPPAPAMQIEPTADPVVDTSTSSDVSVPSAGRAVTADTSPTAVPATAAASPTDTPSSPVVDAVEVDDDSGEVLPWLVGLGGATVLASGLLARYRVLRRRQATAGAAVIRRSASQGRDRDVERALVAASDAPLVHWASHRLAELLYGLDTTRLDGAPVAVELSEERGVELLWDAPNPTAPPPWRAHDGGWAWRLAYDPDEPVPSEGASAPLPGLVTIGERDGNQVLIDLEAFGTLAVTGDDERARDFVRAVVLELGSDDQLADSWIDVVGEPPAGTDPLDRVRTATLEAARRRIDGTVGDYERLLAERDEASTFHLRTATRPGGHELAVVVAIDQPTEGAAALVDCVPARRGVAVVLLGTPPDGRTAATLTIHADGSAELRPLGLALRAAGLPAAAADQVADLLEAAASPVTEDTGTRAGQAVSSHETGDGTATEPDASGAHPADDPSTGVEIDLADVARLLADEAAESKAADDDWAEPHFDVVVRLLGAPTVPGYDLPNAETSLAAFIVCNGGQATADQAINAVWNGRAIQRTTLWNKMSTLRHRLGSALVPKTTDETLRLSEKVGSDLQLFATLAARAEHESTAEAIRLLTRALDLVGGVPFDAAQYDWAHEHQFHAQACELIERAALRLVDLALDADDPAAASHAIRQGLRALPVNEPLYRARMRLEHHQGNVAGVRRAYDEFTRLLDDLDGPGTYQPSRRTRALLEQLVGAPA